MAREIDFYFDFSSPYAFLASTRIEALAERAGRIVRWRPFLLGAVYKALNYHPLEQPAKRAYFLHDWTRSARLFGVKASIPPTFPENLLAASRTTYWLDDRDPRQAAAFAKAAFAAYWTEGKRLSDPDVVAGIAAGHGAGCDEVLAALNDPAVKERLKSETDKAMAAGIFGSPTIIAEGEMFWGSDRLDQVERWLETGGW